MQSPDFEVLESLIAPSIIGNVYHGVVKVVTTTYKVIEKVVVIAAFWALFSSD